MSLLVKFIQKTAFVFCMFSIVFLNSCVTGSMPNLEAAECAKSKETLRKFYSIHFDKGLKIDTESIDQNQFLTDELSNKLKNIQSDTDFFTTSYDDSPRAFRLGTCKTIEPAKTNAEIVLLWKNENDSKQKIIHAELVKQDDKWLINNILQ